jgi:hypothetical protein
MKKHLPSIRDYGLIVVAAMIQALSLRLFFVPADLASGGVSGISQLINHFTGWPIGLMILDGQHSAVRIGLALPRRSPLRPAHRHRHIRLFRLHRPGPAHPALRPGRRRHRPHQRPAGRYLPQLALRCHRQRRRLRAGLPRARLERRLGHPGPHPQPLARDPHDPELPDGGYGRHPRRGIRLRLEGRRSTP